MISSYRLTYSLIAVPRERNNKRFFATSLFPLQHEYYLLYAKENLSRLIYVVDDNGHAINHGLTTAYEIRGGGFMKSVFFNDIADHGARSPSRFLNSLGTRNFSADTNLSPRASSPFISVVPRGKKCEIASGSNSCIEY